MGKKGRTPKALSTRGLGQHAENLKIKGLANGISCVFCKTCSVNKNEGKCNSYLFTLLLSSVICKVHCLPRENKGKTMTPLKRLQAKGETSTLQTGKKTNKMWKIFQLYRINDKNYLRKWKKKNLISAVRTGVCPYARHAPGTEMRFSKRDRGNSYSAKITCIESWAILLRKILSCELNSLKGAVCVSRSAFVWGDNNARIFYKTSKALSTLLHIWLSDGSSWHGRETWGFRASKQNGSEICTGCRMTKITIGITRLWENLHRDERFIELYWGPSHYTLNYKLQSHSVTVRMTYDVGWINL